MDELSILNELIEKFGESGINIIHTYEESYSNVNSPEIDLFSILNEINNGLTFDEAYQITYINSCMSKEEILNLACEKNYINEKGEILPEGYEFVINNEWMFFYDAYLSNFNFDDFNYFYKNSKLDLEEAGIEFLNESINFAYKNNDFDRFIDTLKAKAHIYDHIGKFSKSLRYELKVFIYNLNPIFADKDLLNSHVPLDNDNIKVLRNFNMVYSTAQIKKYFNKEWKKCSFEKTFISKNNAWKILNNLLKGYSLDEYLEKLYGVYVIK